jgi:hypothetical protein
MSQNDLVIANQTFPATRADITSALQALGSNNSGPSAPSTTYANMMWYDTTSKILKIRAEANDAWINIGYLDQSLDTFKVLDDTVVATTAGATTGLIGDQTTNTWETGTGTTESLVSPAKVKAAILANASGIQKYIGTPLSSWSVNANYAFSHNLGTTPSNVTVCLIAKTANNGFSVGDVIMPGSGYRYAGWGIFINKVTTSSVQLRVNGAGIRWDNPSTGAEFTIQNSTNWSLSCNVIG